MLSYYYDSCSDSENRGDFAFGTMCGSFFIMVTGYYTNVEYDVLVRRAKKIFYLIVIATIIYLPLNILVHWAQGNMNFWLSEIQKPEILFKIIVLNWTTPIWGVGHLWYLFAFLYAF